MRNSKSKKNAEKKYDLGDVVKVRIRRMDGGASHMPGDKSLPLVECVVDQTNVCGIPGCYGLRYRDTNTFVGIPFYSFSFEEPGDSHGEGSECYWCNNGWSHLAMDTYPDAHVYERY